jgi:hypothetical protein
MSIRNTGDRVAHASYGHGTVRSVNEYHTVIEFDAHGTRTFVSPRVVLTDSMVPAPEKPARTRKAPVRKKKEESALG